MVTVLRAVATIFVICGMSIAMKWYGEGFAPGLLTVLIIAAIWYRKPRRRLITRK